MINIIFIISFLIIIILKVLNLLIILLILIYDKERSHYYQIIFDSLSNNKYNLEEKNFINKNNDILMKEIYNYICKYKHLNLTDNIAKENEKLF